MGFALTDFARQYPVYTQWFPRCLLVVPAKFPDADREPLLDNVREECGFVDDEALRELAARRNSGRMGSPSTDTWQPWTCAESPAQPADPMAHPSPLGCGRHTAEMDAKPRKPTVRKVRTSCLGRGLPTFGGITHPQSFG